MASEPSSFQASLDQIIGEERRQFATKLAWVRLSGALAIGLTLWLAPVPGMSMLPTRIAVGAFMVFGSVLLVLLYRRPAVARWAGFTIPFLDVPVIALSALAEQRTLANPAAPVPFNIGLLSGMIVLSALTLSRSVIAATSVMALVTMVLVQLQAGLSPPEIALFVIGPAAISAICIVLVQRVGRLAQRSRQRDLLGKYVLGERIGIGGMAEVFDATYSPEGGFERRVAVKRILPTLAGNPDAVALFRREAELGASLAHPNIVQVLDFGADADTFFLAMEFVEGVSLEKVLDAARVDGEPLPLSTCTFVLWQLAEALDYIHQRRSPTGELLSLVHRDLNPPNVMVSRNGEVKLADFGIARSVQTPSHTRTGAVRGKLGYMAPEQLLSKPYDARADLFALGVTMHELLNGRRLFSGESDLRVIQACIEAPVLAPSALRADAAPLDAVVMGLLERDVTRRTQTAREVREALWGLPRPLVDLAEGRQDLARRVSQVSAAKSPAVGETALRRPPLGPAAATRTVEHAVTRR
jgi:hypothetical protein